MLHRVHRSPATLEELGSGENVFAAWTFCLAYPYTKPINVKARNEGDVGSSVGRKVKDTELEDSFSDIILQPGNEWNPQFLKHELGISCCIEDICQSGYNKA